MEGQDVEYGIVPRFKLNHIYYYVNQKIVLLKIFEEIQMVKVRFVMSSKERIVDIGAITIEPVYEISISIKLLDGDKR